MTTEAPSTAAAGPTLDVRMPSELPPPPGVDAWWLILIGGPIWAGFALGVFWSLFPPVPLPTSDRLTLGLISLVPLLFGFRVWWRTLTRPSKNPTRWVGLVFPFFVVVGVAVGFVADLYLHR